MSPPPTRSSPNNIAKTYRQAANLFLTRRLPEALSTIEPILTPQPDLDPDAQQPLVAPVAHASRSSRIKVWVFWLTFISCAIQLGPEEGKHAFGTDKWLNLIAKARQGHVWHDLLEHGYAGIIANIDGEVMVNFATLLLAHAPSQHFNQKCIEAYLAAQASPRLATNMDAYLTSPRRSKSNAAVQQRQRLESTTATQQPGTNTPRNLQLYLKLLELYTLHVLPRSGKWEQAREVIMMNELLDDEHRDLFLQALHELREEEEEEEEEEAESGSTHIDYSRQQEIYHDDDGDDGGGGDARGRSRRAVTPESKRLSTQQRLTHHYPSSPETGRIAKAATPKKHDSAIVSRIGILLSSLASLRGFVAPSSPRFYQFLQTLVFLLAFTLAVGKREIRLRIQHLAQLAWSKLQTTLAMAFKVPL